jgi:hypothetical protein
MRTRIILPIAAIAAAALVALAQPQTGDYEKQVKEADVPKAALATLKKLAGEAKITEYAEEVEHGRKFYEGSWSGPHGHIDALVTEAGDLVEIEEAVPSDTVPARARDEARKEAGEGAQLSFEKKTIVMYEVHYKKDGKGHEAVFLPDGRRYHEEGGHGEDHDEDEGEKEEK